MTSESSHYYTNDLCNAYCFVGILLFSIIANDFALISIPMNRVDNTNTD